MIIAQVSTLVRKNWKDISTGVLVDAGATMGYCAMTRDSNNRAGIVQFSGQKFIQHFQLLPRDLNKASVCHEGSRLFIQLYAHAKTPGELKGATDYANLIAVDERGPSLCVRELSAASASGFGNSAKRIDLQTWRICPDDAQYGNFDFFDSWDLLAGLSGVVDQYKVLTVLSGQIQPVEVAEF